MQFCRAMLDLEELCRKLDRSDDAQRFAGLHSAMAGAINEHAWDGAWYARAFDDDGLPIGVAGAEHQAIDLVPQSWSVLGKVAPVDRAERAMRSADDKLNTRYGMALLWPPYDGVDERVQGTSTFVPGSKETRIADEVRRAHGAHVTVLFGERERAPLVPVAYEHPLLEKQSDVLLERAERGVSELLADLALSGRNPVFGPVTTDEVGYLFLPGSERQRHNLLGSQAHSP